MSRPESYSTKGPAVVGKSWDESRAEADEWNGTIDGIPIQVSRGGFTGTISVEKPKLSVEQVHFELRKAWAEFKATQKTAVMNRMGELIDQLPKVDVVEWCTSAYCDEPSGNLRNGIRAAIRRYLELRGLPADPDLESQ